ncbi:MAG: helix-turn-helix domain-containing protein [Pseudomonadota bacterium]
MAQTAPDNTLAYRDTDQPGEPWVVTDAGRALILKDRSNGVAQAVIAGRLGMSSRTFRDVLDRCEASRAAYDEGTGLMETELVSLLMQHARDGDRTSIIFALKALAGKREVGPAPDAPPQANTPAINIMIPAMMPQDQLEAMTAQMRNVSPADTDTDTTKRTPARVTK